MSLNEAIDHPAYRLGRLFAVLEKAQREAVRRSQHQHCRPLFHLRLRGASQRLPDPAAAVAGITLQSSSTVMFSDQLTEEILQPLDVENNRIPVPI